MTAKKCKCDRTVILESVVVDVTIVPRKGPHMKPFFVLLLALVLIGCSKFSPEDSFEQQEGFFEHDDTTGEVIMACLSDMQITDAGLEHLKGLARLKYLNLSGTQVTDAGLARLQGLTSLTFLNLRDTRISDAGLAYLKGLASFRVLNLSGTQITDAGRAELKLALPTCRISGP